MYRETMYRTTIAFLLMFWLLSSCDVFTLEEGVIYPSTFKQLDTEILRSLNDEFRSLNNDHICSTLNEYGYTGYSEILFEDGVNPCSRRESVLIAMNEPDTLDSYVQEVLLRNSKFTGVHPESNLVLRLMQPYRIVPINEGPGFGSEIVEWRLVYDNQTEESANIPSTEIEVIVDALGVNRIWGNHYPDVYIPLVPNVNSEKAQEIVNDFQNLQGKLPLCTSPEDIQISNNKKVILNNIDNKIEIRIGWPAVSSAGNDLDADCSFIVDLMDGSIFLTEPDSVSGPVL